MYVCVGVDGTLPLPAMEDDTQLMDTCSPSTPPARPNTRGYLKVFPQGHLTMERNYPVTEGVCVGGGGGGGGWVGGCAYMPRSKQQNAGHISMFKTHEPFNCTSHK